jgi:Tfp pilus assembly protein PilX
MNVELKNNYATQAGVASLVVILILLLSISAITLYSANNGIMEQKVSVNDYRAKQLAEAADAGLEYAMSWLIDNSPAWITDPSDSNYEIHDGTITTSLGNGYSASVSLRRPTANISHVTVTATAAEDGNSALTVTSTTQIVQDFLLATDPGAPIVINGCMSGVLGNPSLDNDDGGDDIVTSQSAACIDEGHFNDQGGDPPTPSAQGNAFVGTAWARTFGGISQDAMQKLANDQMSLPIGSRTVHWIDSSHPEVSGSNWHTDLGSTSPVQSVIAIFADCISINAGTKIVGIAFYFGGCTNNGWGGADLYGSLVVEGDITAYNANADIRYQSQYVTSLMNDTTNVGARIPGSWIDQ